MISVCTNNLLKFNTFRQIKTEQLVNSSEAKSSQEPLGTPIEQALGMNEESLRYTLFSRQGLPERLLIRLQKLTGVVLISRNEVEETYSKWLDYLFL